MSLLPRYVAAILLVLAATFAAVGVSQGGRQRILERLFSAPEQDEPVQMIGAHIDDLRGGEKPVKFGELFDGNDDWLKGLVVQVKNTSGKPITYIGIELLVSVPTSDDPMHAVMVVISYGKYPEHAKAQGVGQKPVNPDEVVELKIQEREYNLLKHLYQSESGKATYDKASLLLGDVLFADGDVYRSGRVKKYEPYVPSKISLRKKEEVPAKPTGRGLFQKISFAPGPESFFTLGADDAVL